MSGPFSAASTGFELTSLWAAGSQLDVPPHLLDPLSPPRSHPLGRLGRSPRAHERERRLLPRFLSHSSLVGKYDPRRDRRHGPLGQDDQAIDTPPCFSRFVHMFMSFFISVGQYRESGLVPHQRVCLCPTQKKNQGFFVSVDSSQVATRWSFLQSSFSSLVSPPLVQDAESDPMDVRKRRTSPLVAPFAACRRFCGTGSREIVVPSFS